MTFEINTKVARAMKWEEIPNGVFIGKRYEAEAYKLCVWMKLDNCLYFIKNLFNSYSGSPRKMDETPKEVFQYEPITFVGV